MSNTTSIPPATQKRKSKPGEWWFVTAIVCALVAPVLIGITLETEAKVATIRKEGVVAEAVVKGHRTEEHTSTGTKGRTRSTTSYLLSLSYDLMSKNRFVEWNAGKAYLPSPNPAQGTAEIEVSQAQYNELSDGTQTLVALIPYQSDTMKLASEMKWLASGTQSLIQFCIAGVAALMAIWAGWRGWKARRAWKAAGN